MHCSLVTWSLNANSRASMQLQKKDSRKPRFFPANISLRQSNEVRCLNVLERRQPLSELQSLLRGSLNVDVYVALPPALCRRIDVNLSKR